MGKENKIRIGAAVSEFNYDITMVRGVKNILFGGEGLFFATLKGPGKVWLQSMPALKLARKIAIKTGGGKKSIFRMLMGE